MRRLDDGERIREAMHEAGFSCESLAAETKRVDPAGYGISRSLIGALISQGVTARENCRDRSGALLAKALKCPVGSLFAPDGS